MEKVWDPWLIIDCIKYLKFDIWNLINIKSALERFLLSNKAKSIADEENG